MKFSLFYEMQISKPNQLAFENDLQTLHDEWAEALEIIPRMWREQVFSWNGRFFNIPRIQVIPKPVQEPHPRANLGFS